MNEHAYESDPADQKMTRPVKGSPVRRGPHGSVENDCEGKALENMDTVLGAARSLRARLSATCDQLNEASLTLCSDSGSGECSDKCGPSRQESVKSVLDECLNLAGRLNGVAKEIAEKVGS